MGAGRKTETYTLAPDGLNAYGPMCVRNLQKGDLCGVIFGCKFSTIKECYAKKLFGLPAPHMAYIKNINPGLTLFLFNYSDRTLHGIFEAASEGKLNIDPKAWSPNGTDPSPYPAQVKVRVRMRCEPLVEEKFSPVIADNYKDEKIFWFELDRVQTNKLLCLFSTSPNVRGPSTSQNVPSLPRKAIPASSLMEIGDVGATRVDKWSSLFKSSDDSSENNGKDSEEGAQGAGSRLVNLGRTRGWDVAANNADEQKAQKSVVQSGASYSSVLRNETESSAMEKKTFSTNEVPSQATKGGPGKEVSAEDTHSEIDWDATSSFQVHLEGLNRILEDPKDGFKSNTGFASSSMVPNHWEDGITLWDYEDRSPCGSSYVSATTGDAFEDNGDEKEKHRIDLSKMDLDVLDVLSEIWAEVKELKQTQMKQAEYMITLQMELLESRKEILQLKVKYGSS